MQADEDPRHVAITLCCVNFHRAVKELNSKLCKNAKKYNFITPRDYLDFIKHFINVLHDK